MLLRASLRGRPVAQARRKARLKYPRPLALGTFPWPRQLIDAELEPALPALSRFHNHFVVSMPGAFDEVIQRIENFFWLFANLPSEIGKRYRPIQQQRNQITPKHDSL
jgi:hypothetical protein